MLIRLKDGELLENHITEFENIIRQLTSSSYGNKEDDKVCNVLISLSSPSETVKIQAK